MENISNITVSELSAELLRRGFAEHSRIKVSVAAVDEDKNMSVTQWNAQGGAFDFLEDEPELYSDDDLIERYDH